MQKTFGRQGKEISPDDTENEDPTKIVKIETDKIIAEAERKSVAVELLNLYKTTFLSHTEEAHKVSRSLCSSPSSSKKIHVGCTSQTGV
ncbi:hypothetical protein J4Q44_G00136200 [Coregonus suidteri]|uniref:Uncharacterized protein n=1 Tax=Coregonus suidteri TaxID=861788 RepID=A0AAN8MEC7_9TELE